MVQPPDRVVPPLAPRSEYETAQQYEAARWQHVYDTLESLKARVESDIAAARQKSESDTKPPRSSRSWCRRWRARKK